MRESHRFRVRGDTRFVLDLTAEQGRIDSQKDYVVTAGKDPIGREMNLRRSRHVDKSLRLESVGDTFTELLCPRPLLARAHVEQLDALVDKWFASRVHPPRISG